MEFDKEYSLFAPNVAPSGMFLYNYPPVPIVPPTPPDMPAASDARIFPSRVPVQNPMPVRVNAQIVDWAKGWDARKLVDELSRAKTVDVIDQAHLDDLGQRIFYVAVAMQLKSPDLYVFPLRGGRQPGIQVGVINQVGKERTVAFNYGQHVNPARHPVIREELRRQLESKIKDGDHLKLAILDTAVGGQGSVNLAKRLREVRDQHYRSMRWSQGERLITQQSTPEISFSVEYYPVENLVIEDWDAGIGLSVSGKDANLELKVLKKPGQVAVRDRDAVTIVASDDVSKFMTHKLTDAVNEAMLSDDDLEFIRNVIEEPPAEEAS